MIRTGDAARLPGTRIQNRCPVVSVGLDAIDSVMGGGLPLSNIYVVSESNSRKFSPLLQRYFVAEGLINKHAVFIDGPTLNFDEFIDNLPSCSTSTATTTQDDTIPSGPQGEMQIAWRKLLLLSFAFILINQIYLGYKTMPAMNSALSAKDKTKFDLTKQMVVNANDIQTARSTSYSALWQHLFDLIKSENFVFGKGKQILRIFIDEIGSPLFEDPQNCRRFLRNLKALIQCANVIVMLNVDESTMSVDENLVLLSIADAFFRLDVPDAETKKNIGLEERYDGHFQIVNLPQLNAFTTNKPDCVDLVFEKHRRYFEIRILHLPAVMGGESAKTPCQSIQDQF